MNPGNTILVSILTSIGMASAAFAAPVGRVHQCPIDWEKQAATCKVQRAPVGGLAAIYDDADQPRLLSVADVQAELIAIRLDDRELAEAAQRTRTGD